MLLGYGSPNLHCQTGAGQSASCMKVDAQLTFAVFDGGPCDAVFECGPCVMEINARLTFAVFDCDL
jgi:hypothetical protein